MFGWRACRYPASKFHEEAGWVLSLTSRSCSSHAQPGRYECHELMSVSVWPRPQHGELSSTSRVESSAFASRYTDATQLCVSGRYTCLRSEEHTSELQSPCNLVCRLLLEKKKNKYREISLTL